MRRLFAMLATASLLVVVGCSKSYDYRIDKTVDDLKYNKRLNDNLMPASTKGKLEENLIYLRPPKNLKETQEFLLPVLEAGRFDLERSFQESSKQSLHVIARIKRPKTTKKKVQTPADTATRGDFASDLLAVLNSAYKPPDELVIGKFKPIEKRRSGSTRAGNEFKQHSFVAGDKTIQVYLFKKDIYDVALIFEYPTTEHVNLQSKLNLCLESFAVGERAKQAFTGTGGDEDAGAVSTPVPL